MPSNNTVSFPSEATIGETEKSLREFFLQKKDPYPETLVLDFSRSLYIEVTTLMFIIALLSDRTSRSLQTKLKLPASKDVRDFIRVWNFPDAIAKAINCTLSSIVCEEDLRYFGENKDVSQIKYKCRLRDESVSRLVFENFFSIITFTPTQMSRTRLVTDESKRWESELILSVLAKHLDGPNGYVASRIVYESMTNATRHPGASIIQTASKFSASGEEKSDKTGHFTILFWDNGRSMVDTLFAAIREGKPIRSKDTPDLYRNHLVVLENDKGLKENEYQLSSGILPTATNPEHEIFFSITFPGITSDVEGKGHDVHINLKTENPALSIPGMGLYVLLNAAIDIYGGSVAFRTKTFFMNVRKAPKRTTAFYRAKIRYFDEKKFPVFRGNLITVRLPIRKHH